MEANLSIDAENCSDRDETVNIRRAVEWIEGDNVIPSLVLLHLQFPVPDELMLMQKLSMLRCLGKGKHVS